MVFLETESPFPNMKIFGCRYGKYSFVITLETRTGKGYENYTGFTASWKNATFKGKQSANRIDGGPWKTMEEAIKNCQYTYHQLRNKQ